MKCEKQEDRKNLIEEYVIQYRNAPRIFKVYNNISLCQRRNRMGYKAVKEILNRLNYESYMDGNKQRLRKRIEEKVR